MYKIVKPLNVFSELLNKFHQMGSSVERMLTIWSNDSVPLNKMAVNPMYGKTLL